MTRRILIFLAATLAASFQLSAQSLPSAYICPDAAVQGLAGSAISAEPGAFAAVVNPSAMSMSEGKLAASVSYLSWMPQLSGESMMSAGAFAKVGSKWAFGLSGSKFGYPEYTVMSESGQPQQRHGTYTPTEMNVGLGASYRLSDNLSLGAATRIASGKLAEDSEVSAFFAEISASWRKDSFAADAAVGNQMARIGAGMEVIQNLNAYASAQVLLAEEGCALAAGAEYSVRDLVYLRAGYNYGSGYAVPSHLSLGLGAKLAGFSLDAAYLLASESLGGSMCIGLGWAF